MSQERDTATGPASERRAADKECAARDVEQQPDPSRLARIGALVRQSYQDHEGSYRYLRDK